MASTFETRFRFEQIGAGEKSGTWNVNTKTNYELFSEAIGGVASVTHDDTANYTLTTANGATDEARQMILEVAGALTVARNVVCPTSEKLYFCKNSTTGGFAFTLKTSGGTGISVPNGEMMVLYCDGTNVLDATTHMTALTLATDLAIADGGTGSSTAGAARTALAVPGLAGANVFTDIQRWAKGGDLTSANPLVIDTDGNYFDVTGTTNFASMTVVAGTLFMLQFDSAGIVMTHNGTTLDLPSEANITTAAGDKMLCFATGTDTVDVITYTRADGTAIVSGATEISGDTSPQLGGVLDTNAFAIDESEGTSVSGATPDIWQTDGNTVHITGATTITSFGTAPRVGAWRKVIFDGTPVITDGANLNLPGGGNITAAVDDIAMVFAETTTLLKVLYFKADGTAVVASSGGDFVNPDRVFFQQTTPSALWTKETNATYDDAGIRLQTGTVTTGGTDAWSVTHTSSKATDATTISIATMAAHTHPFETQDTLGATLDPPQGDAVNQGTSSTNSTGGGGSHTHTMQTDLKFAEASIGTRNA